MRYTDPSGHCSRDGDDWYFPSLSCDGYSRCAYALPTFISAAIKMVGGWEWRALHNKRYTIDFIFNGGEKTKFDSIGKAQISDIEMETPYGEELEDGHKTDSDCELNLANMVVLWIKPRMLLLILL